MFGSKRRKRAQLEKSGIRAPATVLEIANTGWSIGDAGPDRTSSASDIIRMTTLRVEPEGSPPFEVKARLRYGDGNTVPAEGDRIEVLYDPGDQATVVVAPPSAEEQSRRGAAALSASNIGLSMGGGLPTEEAMKAHQEALDQAEQAQRRMQEIVSDPAAAAAAAGSFDPKAHLEHLKALRDSGVLSEEEYEATRRRVEGG
jgi:hypothetical protein